MYALTVRARVETRRFGITNGEDGTRTRIDRQQLSGNALPYCPQADGNCPHLGLLIPFSASATRCQFAVSGNVAKQFFTLLNKRDRPFESRFP